LPHYVMLDSSSDKTQDPRALGKVLTLKNYLGNPVLPVFTSYFSLRTFVKAYYTQEDCVEPTALWIYLPQVAQLAGPMEKAGRLRHLVFNPTSDSPGKWRSRGGLKSVKKFCRFDKEVRPGFIKLREETRAKFGGGFETIEEDLRWSAPHLEKLAKDAEARMQEHEVEE
jgi:hypothetical protein